MKTIKNKIVRITYKTLLCTNTQNCPVGNGTERIPVDPKEYSVGKKIATPDNLEEKNKNHSKKIFFV
jgi:hypothetical protein